MTLANVALAMIPVLIILLPLFFAGWTAWSENRPGGATDYHVRRVKKLSDELGERPVRDPSTLSQKEATEEAHRLEFRAGLRRRAVSKGRAPLS